VTCSDFRDWSAVRDTMPGPDGPVLRIRGTCTCTSTGHRVTLEPDNEGIVGDPEVQVFRVRIEEPRAGGTAMTEEPVAYDGPWDGRSTRVVIRIPNQEPASVAITDLG